MADACPVPGPHDPLVHSLLATTDCHVQALVRIGYGSLFEGSGPFSTVLTALLTAYVAIVGYRLLLGRTQLNVSNFAFSAVKLGAVVALATQWPTYQTVVYQLLFDGPQQVANVILHGVGASDAGFRGDVFVGLQRAFDDLTAFSPASPPGGFPVPSAPAVAPGLAAASPIATSLGPAAGSALSGAGFDALLLLASAMMLLVSSLGVLVASKIVLGMLLALGPIFIALFLFDSTRGLFAGWIRASLGFALAPLSVTLLLSFALTLLGPSLAEIETMRDSHIYIPGVAFGVLVLVLVFAGVAAGVLAAAAIIVSGFKLPGTRRIDTREALAAAPLGEAGEVVFRDRAARTAAAVAAQDRRDTTIFAQAGIPAADRRLTVTASGAEREARDIVASDTRIGQNNRRPARPRARRGA